MRTVRLRFNIFVLLLTVLMPLRTFAAEGKTPALKDEMEAIQSSLRQLNRQFADPTKKASSLEIVAQIQKHAETARSLTPPKAAKMTGDDKTKYGGTFQKDINALLKEIAALKGAINADKTDVAKAEIQKIGDLKNSSHKELGVDMGGGGRRGPRGGEGQPGQPPAPPRQ